MSQITNPYHAQNMINLKDYCRIDGSTDDSSGFTTAYTLASTSGLVLWHPGGTLIKGNDTLLPNVSIQGPGPSQATIKLKNGANADLFSAQTGLINLSAAANTGSVGTLLNFGFYGLTLDGNKANQTSGTSYPLRFYGYNFVLRDVEIINGYSGGALMDWNGGGTITSPSPQMESVIDAVKIHDNNSIGLQIGGPHDSRIDKLILFYNGSHQLHICPNANGLQISNSHAWGCPNTSGICGILDEATSGTQYINCEAEGSYYYNWYVVGQSKSWLGGSIFAPDPATTSGVVGVVLGQIAGASPVPGQINQSAGLTTAVVSTGININTIINDCRGSAISFVNENSSTIYANVYQATGNYILGTPSPIDTFVIRGTGLTADGTLAKSGGVQILSGAMKVLDTANNVNFQVHSDASSVSGFNVPGTIQITSAGTGYNTGGNTGVGLLVDPGSDSKRGLVVFAHSSSQSAPLLAMQNSGFFDVVTVDKDGNTDFLSCVGIGTGHNTSIMELITPNADNKQGLVIFPHSSSQSSSLFAIQNSSFADVLTIDLNGNVVMKANIALGQSTSAAATASNGTIATANISVARVAPTGAITGVILASGAVGGQTCQVVNESAFSITFAASGTSHVADGTSAILAANRMMNFTWNSSKSLWYHS